MEREEKQSNQRKLAWNAHRPKKRRRAQIQHLPREFLVGAPGYRVPPGTTRALMSGQALRNRIYVLCWTWQKHRVVLQKNEAEHLIRVWREWYERQGWHFRGSVAIHPETKEAHACVLHEYDATTYERIA